MSENSSATTNTNIGIETILNSNIEQILTSLPSYRSLDMFYSRLSIASSQELLSLWNERLTDIENYRNQCLESVILQQQFEECNVVEKNTRGWETKPLSESSQQSQSQSQSEVKSSISSSSSSTTNTTTTTNINININDILVGGGDVEYLPLLPEVEELVQSKMKSLKKINSNSTKQPSSKTSGDVGKYNGLRKQDVIYMYQLSAESIKEEDRSIGFNFPTFLNPLCVRCLLSERESSQLIETTGGDIIDDNNNNEVNTNNKIENNNNENDSIQTLFNFPQIITGEVLEVITEKVTEIGKKRYPFLRHLPLDSSYRIVEIDMKQIIRPEIYEK